MGNESLANKLGIPLKIPINDSVRHRGCDAQEAILESVEGEYAIYKGVCPEKHQYQQQHEFRRKISELQAQLNVNNGSLSIGGGQSYQAKESGEY